MNKSKIDIQALQKESAPPDEAQKSESMKAPAKMKSESSMERLKEKIRKLKGKNPDIYPMW